VTWNDIPRRPSDRVLRQFAVTALIFFGLIAWRLGFPGNISGTGALAALLPGTIGILGFLWPQAVRGPFLVLTVLALPIGWVVSRVLLAILFYTVFTPVALLFRLTGRRALNLRPDPGLPTYWSPRLGASDPARYFRQF
jgi:hypothetical protein